MKSELELLRKLVSQRNIDKEAEWDMINEKMNEISADREQLENERNRLRQDLIRMVSVAKDMHNVEELLRTNPDESAYVLQAESLKKANNVLQNELQDLIQKEKELKSANDKLWKEKAQLQTVSFVIVWYMLAVQQRTADFTAHNYVLGVSQHFSDQLKVKYHWFLNAN